MSPHRRAARGRLDVDFVIIEPARRAIQPAARLFVDVLKSESERAVAAMAWDG
jgi:hypothetical protein